MPPLQLPVHNVAPKKPPPDDPTILTDVYALLERTFPEVTPKVHKRYLYFKHTPGKATIMTLHDLRELFWLTKNQTEGRPVVEKAINALSDQLRKVLEADTIQWTGSQLTLDYLEARARAIDEALQVRELKRAPLELAKAAAARSSGQLQLKEEGKAQDNSAGSSKRLREKRRRQNRGNKMEEAFAVTAAPANGKPGFKGKCYTCGQEGHVKDDCSQKPKDGATSRRKPGAVCNFCHRSGTPTRRMGAGRSTPRRNLKSGGRRTGAALSRRTRPRRAQCPGGEAGMGSLVTWRGVFRSSRGAGC
jgi:hypothetical protein